AGNYLGGIIRNGRWGWVTSQYASEATLLVYRLASGERVARHSFWRESGNKSEDEHCSIRCVEEIFTDQPDRPVLLAVCLDSWNGSERRPNIVQIQSEVHLYSITYCQVLRVIHISGLVCQSLTYLDRRLCSATQLARFDGCLAVATMEGLVQLIDLNYEHLLEGRDKSQPNQCEIHRVTGNKRMRRLDDLLEECRTNGLHLSVELDVARVGIRSLVGLGLAPGFAAGLDDGRILIYDLISFQLTATLRSSGDLGVVERMCAIVPPDDPKPCFYICAMYRGPDRLTMLLHSINYSSVKQVDEGYLFQNFYATSVRNHLDLDIGDCSVTSCSTASTFSFAGDNGTLLAILSWRSHSEQQNKLVLFDINQWYKDEMPERMHAYERAHYLAGYRLKGLPSGLALLLRPTSILHFEALQRYEEHSYPNSLTFDCHLLTAAACHYYSHDGVQRRFLEALRMSRATLFLHPQACHADIVRLRLLPQFCELNVDATFSKSAMYDVILSVALEHGFRDLLNDCASSWLDGSFLCNMLDPTELSLATLTKWIVRRAGHIKKRISEICQGVFDYGGYSLDERERREFEALSEQMYELVRLQSHILRLGRRSLTSELLEQLESNERALQTVNEYQKVLYWFIQQGLLPEGQHEAHGEEQQPLVALRRSYAERRTQRRRLYIDALTKQTSLVDSYPPDTLQALLHVMLDPDTDLGRKHKLLLYMLLDLDQDLAKRFSLDFQMHEPNDRSVSCLWWLDRGDYQQCLKELYHNRINPPKGIVAWEMQFLVESLLEAGEIKAALRVVSQPPGPLTNTLHLDVLLANNFVPEAFHNARHAVDEEGQPLVERFFRHCIENRRYRVLAELCLTDEEEQMVYRLLKESRSPQAERVNLILLLLKSKYVEAVNFMDDVAARNQRADDDASATSSIMSAYRSTMAPVTKNIAGNYFRIRGKLGEDLADDPNAEYRLPLSCQLARQNARGQLGDIYQSCAISALWAEQCPLPDYTPPPPPLSMRVNNNIPFLRTEQYGFSGQAQPVRLVRPVPHKVVEKRNRELEERDKEEASIMQPRKRRCLQAEQLMENIRGQVNTLLTQESVLEASQEQIKASDLVEPPTYLQTRKQPTMTLNPKASSPLKIPTILKRRPMAEPVVDGTPPTATSTSLSLQPKCFRFQPPIPLRLDSSLARESGGEEEEETDEIIMEIDSRSEPRSAYSAESDEEAEEEEEEEVFLSPLPTTAVSRAGTKLSPSLKTPPGGPQPRGSLLQARTGTGSESSSGFGSFATVQPTQTVSHSQFVPTVCSSKMYETQSQVFSTGSGRAKISERTTICDDMESTDLVACMALRSSSQWSMPAARLSGQTLRMMDTTLDMSTYEATSLEQRGELDDDREREQDQDQENITEEHEEEHQEENEEEEEEEPEFQDEVEETQRSEQITYFRAGPEAPVQEPIQSPTHSSSSAASALSSPEMRQQQQQQQQQEVELVSSNDDEESTGSITTSRSVTHTPEGTFLPSDTNVSQTSSPPRAPHGPGGDGSPRSLYRANSLETVDDLDTTKGSLEEEEEDNEDDCVVIALDGTEVRGYIRPLHPTACSSAELFAFKDECADEAAPGPCPSLSLGATVNSDSVAADIIELDSDDEEDEQKPQHQQQPKINEDEGPEEESQTEMEGKEQHEEQPPAEPTTSNAQDEDSRHSLTLAFSEEEEAAAADEEVAAATADATPRPRRHSMEPHHQDSPIPRRMRRNSMEPLQKDNPIAHRLRRNSTEPHQDSPIARRVRLRSDDSGEAPTVTTPRTRRALKHTALLDVIDEQGSLDESPLPRTRSRLGSVETPTRMVSHSGRSTSLAPPSVESVRRRRSMRGISEPPVNPGRTTPTKPAVEPRPPRQIMTRSRKNSSNDMSPAVSPVPSESEQPRLRRTARRRTSELSENSSSTSGPQIRELRPRLRPTSTEPG
ncbi:hypothetical protein KR059_009731, partial [Drosophila kikkawai]